MSELVEWIGARLDEDEATARAAAAHRTYAPDVSPFDLKHGTIAGHEWRATYDHVYSDWTDGERGKILHVGNFGTDLTRHIARHDPARVLAEVNAKRAIVAHHVEWLCGNEFADWSCDGERRNSGSPDDCATLRLLASVWVGAPGFREEWR